MTVRAAYGRFYDLPHIWNFLGFDRGTPFGTELVVNNGTFDDPWVNTPGGNPFPIVAQPEHDVPAVRRLRDVPARHEAAVRGPVERQRAAAARRGVDGVGQLPHQPGSSSADRRSAESGGLTALARRRRPPTSAACSRSRTRPQGRFYGSITGVKPIGTSEYNGLLLSAQHRSANGLFAVGELDVVELHLGHRQLRAVAWRASSSSKPGDPAYDRGSCGGTDQRHVVNLSDRVSGAGCVGWRRRDADQRLAGVGDRQRAERGPLRRDDRRGQRAERPGQPASEPDVWTTCT